MQKLVLYLSTKAALLNTWNVYFSFFCFISADLAYVRL